MLSRTPDMPRAGSLATFEGGQAGNRALPHLGPDLFQSQNDVKKTAMLQTECS